MARVSESVAARNPTGASPAAPAPLRLLQAGLGGWGSSWAPIVVAAPGVSPAGRVDLDADALAALPDQIEVPGFDSLERALADTDADALLVSAGLGAHPPLARAALEAGLHVLVEKPFAPTLAAARELVALAETRERTLMVSQNYRYHAAPRKVRTLLAENALGEIGEIRIDFRRRFPAGAHRYKRSRQPLLLDMFVHHADLLRFVTGLEPEAVRCRAWNPPWSEFDDPSSAAMTIRFAGGFVASWRGSWESVAEPTPWSGAWAIEGERGVVAWASRDDTGRRYDRVALDLAAGDRTDYRLADVEHRDRAGTLQAFARAVRGDAARWPLPTGHDNLSTLALCFAAIESARSGAEVRLAELGGAP